MLTNTSKWSHARGNTMVPSRWQATINRFTRPPLEYRTTKITDKQFATLIALVGKAMPDRKRQGRPRALTLEDRVRVTLMYLRTNQTQVVIGSLFGVSQPVVSTTVAAMTDTLAWLLKAFVPDPEMASSLGPVFWLIGLTFSIGAFATYLSLLLRRPTT